MIATSAASLMLRRASPFLLTLGLVFAPALASAQSDSAAAQSLFDSGKELMKAGKFAEACAKLEKSQALDPAGGTLLHLASCREQEGKLASAWAHYNEALSAARRDRRSDRETIAAQKVKELAPRLARLTIVVEAPVTGLEVKRGGSVVDPALLGTALPIDRGEYEIVASAPGYLTSSQKVLVARDGEAVTVKLPALKAAPAEASSPAPAAAPAASPSTAPAPATNPPPGEEAPSGSPVKRTVGIVMMGTGAAAVVAGGVFGFLSMDKASTGKDHCTFGASGDECDDEGYDARKNALTYGNVSTILIPAGLVIGGVGAFLFVTSPETSGASGRSHRVTPVIGRGLGGVEVSGVF